MGRLVIMARAPRVGAVKRRLARDIGAVAAWRFYEGNLAALTRRLAPDPRWITWLALTPDRAALRPPRRAARRARPVGQGRGDLGARMGRFLAGAAPGPVVIVGSDVPAIEARHVAHAFRVLGRADWVFGPALDGGYWLIGAARRRPMPRDLFAGVRWSTGDALADTVRALGDARVAYLETLGDIDTGADLRSRGAP